MVSLVDPNFVAIGQTPFCPIHHRTLSFYSPFVSRRELPPVKASRWLLCAAAITRLFFVEFQRTSAASVFLSVFIRFTTAGGEEAPWRLFT